jgi:hypothetical protein
MKMNHSVWIVGLVLSLAALHNGVAQCNEECSDHGNDDLEGSGFFSGWFTAGIGPHLPGSHGTVTAELWSTPALNAYAPVTKIACERSRGSYDDTNPGHVFPRDVLLRWSYK